METKGADRDEDATRMTEASESYRALIPLIPPPQLKQEVLRRLAELNLERGPVR